MDSPREFQPDADWGYSGDSLLRICRCVFNCPEHPRINEIGVRLDVPANNAGIFKFLLLEETTEDEVHRLLAMKEAVKHFGANGGSIINNKFDRKRWRAAGRDLFWDQRRSERNNACAVSDHNPGFNLARPSPTRTVRWLLTYCA